MPYNHNDWKDPDHDKKVIRNISLFLVIVVSLIVTIIV